MNAVVAAPFVLRHSYRLFAQRAPEYSERVVRLMRESLIIVMFNQFLYRIDQKDLKEKWLTQPGAFTATDFLRFNGTGVSVVNSGEGADGFADAELLFAKWNSFIAQYPQWLMRIHDVGLCAGICGSPRFRLLFCPTSIVAPSIRTHPGPPPTTPFESWPERAASWESPTSPSW